MASYIEKPFQCKCCGKESTAKIVRGCFVNQKPDLDSYPHHPAIYDRVITCPYCGYAAERINTCVSEKNKVVVCSDEYQSIFTAKDIPYVVKKNRLYAMLCIKNGKYREAAFSYLRAYWYLRDIGAKDLLLLKESIDAFTLYLSDKRDVNAAIVLIDCMRQMGCQAEALESAESLEHFVTDEWLLRVIGYEKELIEKGDVEPHSIDEVQK